MKSFLKNKFETLYFFYRYLGVKMFLLLLFGIFLVLMDSIGMALFIPLIQVADNSIDSTQHSDRLGTYVKELFSWLHLPITLYSMLALIVVIFGLKGLFTYLSNRYSSVNIQLLIRSIRQQLASGLQNLNYQEFVEADIGRVQNSLMGESASIAMACSRYLDTIKNVFFILTYLAFAFFIEWKFSLLVVIGGVITNFVYKRFYVYTKDFSRKITKNNHRYGATVIEIINHFKYLKATGRGTAFFKRLNTELVDLISNNLKVVDLDARLAGIREPMTISIICVVIAIYIMIYNAPLASIIVILLLFFRIMQKVVDLQTGWNGYLALIGSLENQQDFQKFLRENAETNSGTAEIEQIDTIELKDVELYYGEFKGLDGINLRIERNQSVAFVGESGSGKTSLVNLLCKLFSASSGQILVNDKNVNDYSNESYRSRIGYISQEPAVFNASIFDNITFWAERTPENIEKFNKVLQMSRLSSFMEELPEKENTMLGNNGINVSGGQKQRISIARELYRDVEVLIMDEATSALDSETEYMIKESIESIQGEITIISIAHRLSTIRNSDVIYLLEKGKITAKGNFEELKQRSDYFKRLAEFQGL